MKAALIIMQLLSSDPPIVIPYPTVKSCWSAVQIKLLEKPAGALVLITCGALLQPEEDNDDTLSEPMEKPKGEKIE